MPRIARKGLGTSFFHVIVQGINKEYIFCKEEYIEKYLELINKHKENYNIQILAYCVMNNHAHLLIYSEDSKEMGRFMHKVNCIYAQYYNKIENRAGVLFRNRYVSEPIYQEGYLVNCINYIHMNPVKANIVSRCSEYKYSSFNEYTKNEGVANSEILIQIFGKLNWNEVFNVMDKNMMFRDIESNKEDVIDKVINRIEIELGKTLKEIINDENLFIKLIKILKDDYKITYAQIAKKCNISKNKFDYFWRKKQKRDASPKDV